MIEIRLGTRYAKSILDLAIERGELEQVKADFDLIQETCDQSPDFELMLKSPLINAGKKQTIIDLTIGKHFSEITKNLVQIIVRKKREAYLPDITDRFLFLYDKEKNITRGSLTSAQTLSDEVRKQIVSMVEKDLGTNFILDEKVDPELIGGFVLRIGDKLYDGSVATGLRKLRQDFERNPYIKL